MVFFTGKQTTVYLFILEKWEEAKEDEEEEKEERNWVQEH